MTRILFKIIITAVFVLMSPIGGGSVEWTSLGYGTLDNSARFNVFVDTDSIRNEDGKVKFWQGHVFYTPQPLPSGKSYVRVSILRVANCPDNSDSTMEAVFYGEDGSIVERYTALGEAQFNPVIPGTTSGAVLQFVCDYGEGDL